MITKNRHDFFFKLSHENKTYLSYKFLIFVFMVLRMKVIKYEYFLTSTFKRP